MVQFYQDKQDHVVARSLLAYEPEQLAHALAGLRKFCLVFDNGEIRHVTKKKVFYSSFFWSLIKQYPKTPLLPEHYVEHVLKGAPLNSETHLRLAENVIRTVEQHNLITHYDEREKINQYVYIDCCERLHNQMVIASKRHVAPIGLWDIIEVASHPEIKQAVSEITFDSSSINAAYSVVERVMKTDKSIRSNGLVKAYYAKIVNFQQICQIVAARGFPTEFDGRIFRTPIRSNYLTGVKDIYEFAADSCGARKALANSEKPLQEAEYFARRLQILTMSVERIAPGDCGSTKYLNWIVRPPQFDDTGTKVYAGDLEFMKGKYYHVEGESQYRIITGDDPTLYGKTLKLRSGIFCTHPDPHSICEVCFGQLSRNVSRFDNLGHIASATMTEQTSQSVLSTKHLVVSGVGAPIVMTAGRSRYFELTQTKTGYIFKKEYESQQPLIVVSPKEVIGLSDIGSDIDLDEVNPEHISYISSVDIITRHRGITTNNSVELQQGNRKGVITLEFLKFLKAKYIDFNKWEHDERNNFVFNLEGWDYSKPMFRLPSMEYSFSEHSQEIARTVESNMKDIGDREKPDSPAVTLQQLFNLVNAKLWVNLAALEVIVYATMIPSKHNYSLARNAKHPIMGVAKRIIAGRSIGAAFAYERHTELLTNPKTFIPHNRPNSIFDVFVSPREVVEEYKDKSPHLDVGTKVPGVNAHRRHIAGAFAQPQI